MLFSETLEMYLIICQTIFFVRAVHLMFFDIIVILSLSIII